MRDGIGLMSVHNARGRQEENSEGVGRSERRPCFIAATAVISGVSLGRLHGPYGVLASCECKGALDKDIRNPKPNALPRLGAEHPEFGLRQLPNQVR